MDLIVVAGLALVLGVVAGYALGLARTLRLEAQRRAAAGAASGFARLWPETLPTRSAADIVAGRVVVVLGGVPYVLPVLPIGPSREWLADLDRRFASLSDALDQAGDDKPLILTLLAGHSDLMLAALRAYDVGGVLPDDSFVREYATDAEILRATIEVWRAANPLAATLAEQVDEETSGTSLDLPNDSPPSTAGDPSTSGTSSPTSKSSRSSTRRPSASRTAKIGSTT